MARNYQAMHEQDARDRVTLAHYLSSPLHHCTETKKCSDPTVCPMCSNAARLAIQQYRPLAERRVVQSLMNAYGVECDMPHFGDLD